MNIKKSVLFILLILIIDQWSKIYIKTHFVLGESVEVFSWFKILFIENEGAAWGAKLSDILPISDNFGKLVLTIFRLFAIFGIGYWLFDVIKKKPVPDPKNGKQSKNGSGTGFLMLLRKSRLIRLFGQYH